MWPIECLNIILWWYIGYREMLVNLVLLDLWHFNVILGMDWLASYHASVDCFGKMVMFHIFVNSSLVLRGNMWTYHCIWSQPCKLVICSIRKGYQCFLAYVVSDENDLRLENISIVRNYPFVFLDYLPSLPLKEGGVNHWFGNMKNSYL